MRSSSGSSVSMAIRFKRMPSSGILGPNAAVLSIYESFVAYVAKDCVDRILW